MGRAPLPRGGRGPGEGDAQRAPRGVLLGGVDLDLDGRAVIAVAGHEDVEWAVGQTDDAVHLRPELHVVAWLRHGLVDDPVAPRAVVVVVHEEIHSVRYVLGQEAERSHRLADVLVAAIARPHSVRFVEEAIAHAVVRVVHALRLGRLLHEGHHGTAQRRHERVAFGELVPRDVFGAGLRDVAGPRIGRGERTPRVVEVEARHVAHLLALGAGHAELP